MARVSEVIALLTMHSSHRGALSELEFLEKNSRVNALHVRQIGVSPTQGTQWRQTSRACLVC